MSAVDAAASAAALDALRWKDGTAAPFAESEKDAIEALATKKGVSLTTLSAYLNDGVLYLSPTRHENPGANSGFGLWVGSKSRGTSRSCWVHGVTIGSSLKPSYVGKHIKVDPETLIATGFRPSDKMSAILNIPKGTNADLLATSAGISLAFAKTIAANHAKIWTTKTKGVTDDADDILELLDGGALLRERDADPGLPPPTEDVIYAEVCNWGGYIESATVEKVERKKRDDEDGEAAADFKVTKATYGMRPPLTPLTKYAPTVFGLLVYDTVITEVPCTSTGVIGTGDILYKTDPVDTTKRIVYERAIGPQDLTAGSTCSVLLELIGVNVKSGKSPDIKVKVHAAAIVITQRERGTSSAADASVPEGSPEAEAKKAAIALREKKKAEALLKLAAESAGEKRGREETTT